MWNSFKNFYVIAGAQPETRAGPLRKQIEVLVEDVSKWVRPAAQHSLGPFLATLKSEDITDGKPAQELSLIQISLLCLVNDVNMVSSFSCKHFALTQSNGALCSWQF